MVPTWFLISLVVASFDLINLINGQSPQEIPYEKQLIQRIIGQYSKIGRIGRPLLY